MSTRRDVLGGLGALVLIGGAGFGPKGCSTPPNFAAHGPRYWIVGDSIGEGLRWASGELGDTKRGLPMTALDIVAEQCAKAPSGSRVVISLGTNDAIAGMTSPDLFAHNIVAMAGGSPLWLGPPHVLAPWDKVAALLDTRLGESVTAAGGVYVSARDPGLDRFHAPDGVHYSLAGYRALWAKIVSAR